MTQKKGFSLKYKLQQIRTIKFVLVNPTNKDNIKKSPLEFTVGFKINTETEIIIISLGVTVFDNENQKNKLCELVVEFEYHTIGLKNFEKKDDKIKLPNDFMISLLSISYNTLRGIFNEKCATTQFSNLILPIIDSRELLPKFDKVM